MLIVDKTNSVIAINENEIFENVIIKGTLTVGEGENKIILKNDGKSEIIIQSRKTGISISSSPKDAHILLIPDASNKDDLDAIMISAKENKLGRIQSDITLIDERGVRQIKTTEDRKERRY